MRQHLQGFLAVIVAIGSLTPVLGQSPRGQRDAIGSASLPKVGTKLPDLNLFDDQGHPFSTRQLRGKYTVLVFGCLT